MKIKEQNLMEGDKCPECEGLLESYENPKANEQILTCPNCSNIIRIETVEE